MFTCAHLIIGSNFFAEGKNDDDRRREESLNQEEKTSSSTDARKRIVQCRAEEAAQMGILYRFEISHSLGGVQE